MTARGALAYGSRLRPPRSFAKADAIAEVKDRALADARLIALAPTLADLVVEAARLMRYADGADEYSNDCRAWLAKLAEVEA